MMIRRTHKNIPPKNILFETVLNQSSQDFRITEIDDNPGNPLIP